ncbi:hypothetical protein HY494_00980, partial [Candidatus Woesearchaeota archaeon]|nr:hypothetical protein [Candidatus Woesearchaeota archaeon]
MNPLERYASIAVLALGSFSCCNLANKTPPTIQLPPVESVNCYYGPSELNTTICEFDYNDDGKVDQITKETKDDHNNCLTRLVDSNADGTYEREETFVYYSLGQLEKQVVKEGRKTAVYEYSGGKIVIEKYDSDSDENYEEVYVHLDNGHVAYFGDENDDGAADIISKNVTADYAASFDPDGNDGVVYKKILNISRDYNFNGIFDQTEFLFNQSGRIIQELILYDKDEDGKIDKIIKKRYD